MIPINKPTAIIPFRLILEGQITGIDPQSRDRISAVKGL